MKACDSITDQQTKGACSSSGGAGSFSRSPMANAIFAVAFFVLLLFAPGHAEANAEPDLTGVRIYHGETPPSSTLSLSVSNPDPQREGRIRASCEKVEAAFQVLGTIAPTGRKEEEVRSLALLHDSRFVLAPGEVQPFQFRQASSITETVIFQTVMSERAARCLAHSSVTVQNAAGDLVSVVPVDPSIGVIVILESTGPSTRCCDCAPICACGICD
jgi:hypothetical protein